MCGIVGAFNIDCHKIESRYIKKMTDAIAHRGPDEENILMMTPFAGFGHRRLSIIDLSKNASQPMRSVDGRFTIVYNGELYNYKELKKELCLLGYKFNSSSDTEVVLYSYAKWGVEAFKRFNGIFAIAVYDSKNNNLIIARDRYGTKPVYYTIVDNTILFASEQKAFLEYPGFKKIIDLEAVKEYFTFQNIFTNKTFYKNVVLLEAGSYITISEKTTNSLKEIETNQYWDFDFHAVKAGCSELECEEELERLFVQAVNRQLVSDVPVGAYLSGGMDSGAITAVAARQIPFIKSFTCGFDLHSVSGLESSFDERVKAEYLSYCCKSEHYEVVLKAGDMERVMKNLVWHIEEPRVGQSYPNFFVASLASKFVKVVLSGAGGDELFGGYPWRYYRAVKNETFDEYVEKYYEYWQRLIPSEYINTFFAPINHEINHVNTKEIFRNVFRKDRHKNISPEECVNHSLYFESKTFLHGLLTIEDKISMSHGLETRVPFLDNDLVDFACQLPVNMKLKNLHHIININENEIGGKSEKYYQKTNDGKMILRNAMNKIIPLETLQAVKQGFSAPDASWYKNESNDYVKAVIYNRNSKIYNYLDWETVHILVNEHLNGKENRRLLIWSLLYFDEWCNLFL